MRRAERKDDNDSALRAVARRCGATVWPQPAGAGFDWLLLHRGRVYIVEIKDGAKPPSARRLTAQESLASLVCAAHRITYHVISTEPELLALLSPCAPC